MRIRRPPEAVAEDREQIGAPEVFESFTWSDELFAAYSSLPSRPERATFTFSFGLHRGVWLPYVYATLLVLVAPYAALTRSTDAAIAAVLTIPTTIVGGFLVSRDSVLVARFLQWPRLFLMATNPALWIIVLGKLGRDRLQAVRGKEHRQGIPQGRRLTAVAGQDPSYRALNET